MRPGGGNEMPQSAPRDALQVAGDTKLPAEHEVPFGQLIRQRWAGPGPPSIGEGAGAPASQAEHPRTTTDGMAGQAGHHDPEDEDEAPGRKRDRRDEDGEVVPKRM